MSYLDWLEQTVRAQLAREAIGRPVFLRASLEISADHGLLTPILARSLENAANWLRSPLTRVYAQGGVREGFVSALAEFAGGQTALVSTETTFGRQAQVELLCVGQHGTLRFQDQPEPIQLREIGPANQALAAAIEQSLRAGQPVEL